VDEEHMLPSVNKKSCYHLKTLRFR